MPNNGHYKYCLYVHTMFIGLIGNKLLILPYNIFQAYIINQNKNLILKDASLHVSLFLIYI